MSPRSLLPNRLEFQSTHWSVVLEAAKSGSEDAHRALTELCETYWYPLYAYARRRGLQASTAEDVTQGFFQQLLAKNSIAFARPDRGRFRSFLLASLRNYMANEHRQSTTQRRGGKMKRLPFDAAEVEQRLAEATAGTATPEIIFDRCWLSVLIETVKERLRSEYIKAGRDTVFEAIHPYLVGDESRARGDLASQLGISEAAIGMSIHRMRRRFGELLRIEINRTLVDGSDLEDELNYLLSLAGQPA